MQLPLTSLEASRPAEFHVAGPIGFEDVKHRCTHRINPGLMRRRVDQVIHLLGIRLQVVQLIFIPHPVVVDVLVPIATNGVRGRRMGECVLPEVLVDKRTAPVAGLTVCKNGQKGKAVDGVIARHTAVCNVEESWGDIDIEDVFANGGAGVDKAGRPGNHGHAHGLLVGLPLVDQTVLAEHKAVIPHVNHQRVFIEVVFDEVVQYATDTFINAHKGFAVVGDDFVQVCG